MIIPHSTKYQHFIGLFAKKARKNRWEKKKAKRKKKHTHTNRDDKWPMCNRNEWRDCPAVASFSLFFAVRQSKIPQSAHIGRVNFWWLQMASVATFFFQQNRRWRECVVFFYVALCRILCGHQTIHNWLENGAPACIEKKGAEFKWWRHPGGVG